MGLLLCEVASLRSTSQPTDKITVGHPFSVAGPLRRIKALPYLFVSFPRRRESIKVFRKLDSRFHGNDIAVLCFLCFIIIYADINTNNKELYKPVRF